MVNSRNGGKDSRLTQEQSALLALAASKLGMKQSELAEKLAAGDISSLASGGGQLSRVLGDRRAMERVLSSPQAKALMERLSGSSGKR